MIQTNNPIDNFRNTLKRKGAIGSFFKTSDACIIEVAGIAGFDFCVLDMEHGSNSFQQMGELIRASCFRGMSPIIRIPTITAENISKALDLGASGIQVPNVSHPDQIKEVIEYARFAPKGMRGVCRYVRAANFSDMNRSDYFKTSNNTLIIVQIEGLEGVSNIETILEQNGVDVLFIGPYDLSQSLGCLGDTKNELVTEKMKTICNLAASRNVVVGTFVESVKEAEYWINHGVKYICYSVDMGIILNSFKHATKELRSILP